MNIPSGAATRESEYLAMSFWTNFHTPPIASSSSYCGKNVGDALLTLAGCYSCLGKYGVTHG